MNSSSPKGAAQGSLGCQPHERRTKWSEPRRGDMTQPGMPTRIANEIDPVCVAAFKSAAHGE